MNAPLLPILDDLFEERLIQLSQMVEDRKISEGNARIVFKDIRKWYKGYKNMISNKVTKDLIEEISDRESDAEVQDIILEKINSGDFIVISKKEYEGMLRAIKNFQAIKKGKN
jgi:hypothetical protein